MLGDIDMISDLYLILMLNFIDQMLCYVEVLFDYLFGIQFDIGMNCFGMESGEWVVLCELVEFQNLMLVMFYLVCVDEFDYLMNVYQLESFLVMIEGMSMFKSFFVIGGIFLGKDYYFDLICPGVGFYGGLLFEKVELVVYVLIFVI